MKFLADQDVYASTVRFVSGLGHDVVTAGQLGLAQAEDSELLRIAHEQGRIFLTRDRNFGALSIGVVVAALVEPICQDFLGGVEGFCPCEQHGHGQGIIHHQAVQTASGPGRFSASVRTRIPCSGVRPCSKSQGTCIRKPTLQRLIHLSI